MIPTKSRPQSRMPVRSLAVSTTSSLHSSASLPTPYKLRANLYWTCRLLLETMIQILIRGLSLTMNVDRAELQTSSHQPPSEAFRYFASKFLRLLIPGCNWLRLIGTLHRSLTANRLSSKARVLDRDRISYLQQANTFALPRYLVPRCRS